MQFVTHLTEFYAYDQIFIIMNEPKWGRHILFYSHTRKKKKMWKVKLKDTNDTFASMLNSMLQQKKNMTATKKKKEKSAKNY